MFLFQSYKHCTSFYQYHLFVFRGPSLIQYLDGLPAISRALDKPFRMPVVDRYKDMGTILIGKVESGICSKNQSVLLMPNRVCEVFILDKCE